MSSPLNPAAAEDMRAQEEKLKRMYGNLPTKKFLDRKVMERKYFDSGDYALQKAGKTTTPVGSEHPQPENIPHSNPAAPSAVHGSPPVKESSLVHESEIPEGATPTSLQPQPE